jgi:glycosyltransferase involved in cell wall biosynthesis
MTAISHSHEPRKKVVIICRVIRQYRQEFFERLKANLALENIDLELIDGFPDSKVAATMDTVTIPWSKQIAARELSIAKRKLYWQPCFREILNADLVVVIQSSNLLFNYFLVMLQTLGLKKVAFWGHGKNFQGHQASGVGEYIKKLYSTKVHWWFAFTRLSAEVVKQLGYPSERITVVQNSINTNQIIEFYNSLSDSDLNRVRQDLGLTGNNVCIYTGGMYPEKRLPFLIEACQLIRQEIPDFEMLFIGSGKDKETAIQAAQKYSWIHYLGPKFNQDKVPYFKLSKLLLMPGLVGLAIVDSFAMAVPLITTAVDFHSPEIDYLEDGVNGCSVQEKDNPKAYAQKVISLLKHPTELETLREGCRHSAQTYTIETMAHNFSSGIVSALKH